MRQGVSVAGTLVLILSLPAVLALAALTFLNRAVTARKLLLAGLVTLMFVAFLIVAYFHARIGQLLPLTNPFDGSLFGYYKIPPWIESEKLLFWVLLFSVMALIINMRQSRHRGLLIGTNSLLLILILTMATVSSPFSPPLPGFHAELLSYNGALASQDPQLIGAELGRSIGKMMGYYNSVYMWTHPPLLFLAYAAFGVTFVGAIQMLWSKEKILDRVAYNYGRLGFIALTLGLLLGYPWALMAWKGESWWWDPKINMSLMMWVFFAAYLHARLYKHKRKMWITTGALGAAAFTALVLTYLSTYVIPGIHAVAG